jgi:hypothetical protein
MYVFRLSEKCQHGRCIHVDVGWLHMIQGVQSYTYFFLPMLLELFLCLERISNSQQEICDKPHQMGHLNKTSLQALSFA